MGGWSGLEKKCKRFFGAGKFTQSAYTWIALSRSTLMGLPEMGFKRFKPGRPDLNSSKIIVI
jgi:hypothetical protein